MKKTYKNFIDYNKKRILASNGMIAMGIEIKRLYGTAGPTDGRRI